MSQHYSGYEGGYGGGYGQQQQYQQYQQQQQQQQQAYYAVPPQEQYGGGYYAQQPYQYEHGTGDVVAVGVAVFPDLPYGSYTPPGWTNPYLPPDLVDKAARELNETDATRGPALAALRQLMSKEKQMSFPVSDDMFLLAFLRCRKFKVDKAFKNLKAYQKFYDESRHLIESADMSRLSKIYTSGLSRVLPGTDKHGRRVSCVIAKNMPMDMGTNPQEAGEDMLRFNLIMMNYLLRDVYQQVNGVIVLESFEGFSLAQGMQMHKMQDPKMMKKSMALMQGILPVRVQGIYLLYVPPFVSIMLKLAKLFMNKKMRSRIRVWGTDFAPLHEQIDPRELPPEFGGTLADDPLAFWKTFISGRPVSDFYRRGITDARAPEAQKTYKDLDGKMTPEEQRFAAEMGVDREIAEAQTAQVENEPVWTSIDD